MEHFPCDIANFAQYSASNATRQNNNQCLFISIRLHKQKSLVKIIKYINKCLQSKIRIQLQTYPLCSNVCVFVECSTKYGHTECFTLSYEGCSCYTNNNEKPLFSFVYTNHSSKCQVTLLIQ